MIISRSKRTNPLTASTDETVTLTANGKQTSLFSVNRNGDDMENNLFRMLKLYQQDSPEKLNQVTKKELTDRYTHTLKEVNDNGNTDSSLIRSSSYRIDCI